LGAAIILISLTPAAVHAGKTAKGITTFSDPLDKIVTVITGPVAYAVSVLGIVVAGAMLVFGGELNEFTKRMVMLVLVIAVIMFAVQLMTQLWGGAAPALI